MHNGDPPVTVGQTSSKKTPDVRLCLHSWILGTTPHEEGYLYSLRHGWLLAPILRQNYL